MVLSEPLVDRQCEAFCDVHITSNSWEAATVSFVNSQHFTLFLTIVYGSRLTRRSASADRIPLGTEVGLILGDIVLDGDLAPRPLKGHSSHNSWPMSVVVKRPDGPRCHFVLDGDPAPRKKRAQPPPNFCPMSLVVKRLD